LDVHTEEARVKIDAPVEVANQHHSVPDPKGDVVDGFFTAHVFPQGSSAYGVEIYLRPELSVKNLKCGGKVCWETRLSRAPRLRFTFVAVFH
jgi:hypothetical protein